MKSYVQNYEIYNKKGNGEKVINIADIHDLGVEKMGSAINDINDVGAKLVFVTGDIMQGVKYDDPKAINKLERMVAALSENQPVALSFGNHDLVGLTEEGRRNFKNLENVRPGMVFALDNEQVVINNFRVTGFCPTRGAFKFQLQKNGEAHRIFANDFINSGLKPVNDDKIEILMSHAPHSIASTFTLQKVPFIREFDLVFSGHLHNGYVLSEKQLKNPEKYMDLGVWEMPYEKGGIIRPWIYDKTNLCRGVSFIGENGQHLIQLSNDLFYVVVGGEYIKVGDFDTGVIDGYSIYEYIEKNRLMPIVITGGINKFFSLPIDKSEVTVAEIINPVGRKR